MKNLSRALVATAALALVLLYFLPLWRITLDAPQYPEGLGMEIRVNTITGVSEHDLQNINGLNHYIGMKRIEPDSIPELKIMPFVVGALILGGLLTAAFGRRKLLYVWVAAFTLAAGAGLVDFYIWEYDYGHNLDTENAIIKVPGMSYQPPLIGSKQLLNFTANSWPASGGIIAFAAFALALSAVFVERRRDPDAVAEEAVPAAKKGRKDELVPRPA